MKKFPKSAMTETEFPRVDPRSGNQGNEQPVVLKAVYYSEHYDAILAEIVMHGGEEMYTSECLCCGRREIAAVFDDSEKALNVGDALGAIWDLDVEITPLSEATLD
jgi:hypothetical protein